MTMVRETKFTQRLNALMAEKKMTPTTLSHQIYMHPSTVKSYKTGRHEPIVETIIILCEVFNVSADYLIGLTDERKPLKE